MAWVSVLRRDVDQLGIAAWTCQQQLEHCNAAQASLGKVAVPCPPPLSLPAAQAVGTFSQVHQSYVVESRHAEQKAATHVVIDHLETAAWVYPRKRH